MKWGYFTPRHILTLILTGVILVEVYLFLKCRSQKFQTAVLFPLSCLGLVAIVYDLVRWGEPLWNLPLHLCSINAMILPFAVLTRNKTFGNLLLLWCLGALAALVMNFEMANSKLFGESFNVYFFPHVVEFGIPVLLFKLKLVEKDTRCIGSTLIITMALYTEVYLLNKLIRAVSGVPVNYMFSVEPSNPLLALFYKVIPCEYWYMYMVLPIVAVYLLIVYAPELAAKRHIKHLRTAG